MNTGTSIVKTGRIINPITHFVTGDVAQWKKLFRNKLVTEHGRFFEHVYEYTPAHCYQKTTGEEYQLSISNPYQIRIYVNNLGSVIWAIGGGYGVDISNQRIREQAPKYGRGAGGHTESIGSKKYWPRMFSDTKFLLTFERTKKDFIETITKERKCFIMCQSKEIMENAWELFNKYNQHSGRISIGFSETWNKIPVEELKKIGVRFSRIQRKPAKGGNYVHENFNWGSNKPETGLWFNLDSGYSWHGNKGCNSGWVYYG